MPGAVLIYQILDLHPRRERLQVGLSAAAVAWRPFDIPCTRFCAAPPGEGRLPGGAACCVKSPSITGSAIEPPGRRPRRPAHTSPRPRPAGGVGTVPGGGGPCPARGGSAPTIVARRALYSRPGLRRQG